MICSVIVVFEVLGLTHRNTRSSSHCYLLYYLMVHYFLCFVCLLFCLWTKKRIRTTNVEHKCLRPLIFKP